MILQCLWRIIQSVPMETKEAGERVEGGGDGGKIRLWHKLLECIVHDLPFQ